MIKSLRGSHFILRTGLAIVFLWFGIDKFFHSVYWINAWIPKWFIQFVGQFNIDGSSLVYLFGIFEVVMGISLVSGVFMRFFSFLGVMFLVSVIIFIGIYEVTVRDVGLIGGLLSLVFWPSASPGGSRRF